MVELKYFDRVFVIGDAFIDIIIPIKNIKIGETYHKNLIVIGGGTANVAVEVSKLGEKSTFVGKIGNDIFGEYYKEYLHQHNVKALVFIDKMHKTGLCTSLVDKNGDRTLIADRGANDYITKHEIQKYADKILNSKIVYFSGYSLLAKQTSQSILYLMKVCHKNNCKILFNPGAPNLIKDFFKEIITRYVDVLILNQNEAKALTHKKEIKTISFNLEKIVEISVITMNKKGCYLIKDGRTNFIQTKIIPNVLDTTGAGDAFSAGFIVGMLKNLDVLECAHLANKTAMKYIKKRGYYRNENSDGIY